MDGDEPAGGSEALAGLIDEYGEALVPDLLSEYGVDLRDLFDSENPLSPRWVLNLVVHLPIASAFVAKQRGGQEFRGWDAERYALADAATSLRFIKHMYLSAHLDRKKHRLPEPPKAFPTPELTKTMKNSKKPGAFAQMVVNAKRNAMTRKAGRSG